MSEQKSLPVTVEKPIPVTYDLGNLTVFDSNVVDVSAGEVAVQSATRDNVQLLINQLLSLPIRTSTEGGGNGIALLQLPQPTTELPREKALPKKKELTKWEKFAAKKGIRSKVKTGRKVYDEESGEWVNKWGHEGANKKLDSQWLVEVDDKVVGTPDELIDPRSLSRQKRKELIRKNERQQRKNAKN
ncbi:ribosome biogenesis protein RRS1 KNAG_0J00750 [Huiozyma naganishii CBS 8797]|uniref:Ribosome biogenesis regulatory protein n=1 Tax=Huiozyma naganishii (strain ATCC MYA-139 / BCRC 22969 / CBS 8797 / KCTC 17520 / NBRC 10181 / NCYC 3082 / Yp74L-3) TaxID=1071383 RepID=J7RQR8_HUIN7|nr:hypothetical protein KNAG_0J00750 [Kazachstania naganishii CBS 8797]CCK72158.1 hypothetical protein KNAG_0J00750 [Kazachstania naganishii CBS 8797]